MPASPESLSIVIAAPIRPGATSGNSVTASRWSNQLTELGHRVTIVPVVEGSPADQPVHIDDHADAIIVLHARRCSSAARVAKASRPNRPLIVALAGTDLYADLPDDASTRESLELADALVVLQTDGLEHLASMEPTWRSKAHVVHQSVRPNGLIHQPIDDRFNVVVLAYLRDVKDPLLAARAARLLPTESTVSITHAGSAHTEAWKSRATHEVAENPRYRWVGELDAAAAATLLATADVLACTSLLEGGANVVSEAIAQGVAVIGTDIGGNRGLLGSDHPGLVPVGDAQALADLINALEQNPNQLAELTQRSRDRQWMTDPSHERSQWQAVLSELFSAG